MPNAAYRTGSSPSAQAGVVRFFADVIALAGGTRAVVRALGELGYTYGDGAVRTWRRGTKQPPPEVVFGLARHFHVSLDEYVLGEALEVRLRELLENHEQRLAALEASA